VLLSFKNKPLGLKDLIHFIIRTTKIIKRRYKGDVKMFSLGLNIRPYNKLDKEVADFKEYKEGLIMPYNTECFYY